jgi:hypothetical protein
VGELELSDLPLVTNLNGLRNIRNVFDSISVGGRGYLTGVQDYSGLCGVNFNAGPGDSSYYVYTDVNLCCTALRSVVASATNIDVSGDTYIACYGTNTCNPSNNFTCEGVTKYLAPVVTMSPLSFPTAGQSVVVTVVLKPMPIVPVSFMVNVPASMTVTAGSASLVFSGGQDTKTFTVQAAASASSGQFSFTSCTSADGLFSGYTFQSQSVSLPPLPSSSAIASSTATGGSSSAIVSSSSSSSSSSTALAAAPHLAPSAMLHVMLFSSILVVVARQFLLR